MHGLYHPHPHPNLPYLTKMLSDTYSHNITNLYYNNTWAIILVAMAILPHTVKTLFKIFIQPGLLYELIWYCLKV